MCDCAEAPQCVTDWASGDVVCCQCGVVVEGHILDESPEWRNHATDDHAPDRSRVGMADARGRLAGTYLDTGGGARRRRGCGGLARAMASAQDPREQALREGLDLVGRLAVDLGLTSTSTIAAAARELFEDLHEARGVRADNRRAAAAAALYFACKMERAGRELRLISAVCQVEPRALNSATNEYKEHLHAKAYYPRLFETFQAGALISIFLDRLRLPSDQRRRMWRAAHQLDEALVDCMDCGRKPRTICSGILFLAAQREHVPVSKRDITQACAVCQQTLDKVVTQIRGVLGAQ